MKSFKRTFQLGVFTTITVAGAVYYFLKKRNVTAGTLLDKSIESMEVAAFRANAAFKDAQNRARSAYKNVNYHVENLKDDVKQEVELLDNEIQDAANEVKRNVEKGI